MYQVIWLVLQVRDELTGILDLKQLDLGGETNIWDRQMRCHGVNVWGSWERQMRLGGEGQSRGPHAVRPFSTRSEWSWAGSRDGTAAGSTASYSRSPATSSCPFDTPCAPGPQGRLRKSLPGVSLLRGAGKGGDGWQALVCFPICQEMPFSQ